MSTDLLPRASLWDVVRRRACLVGSRLDPESVRGCISPIEPRLVLGILYGDPITEERAYLERRGIVSDFGIVLRTIWARLLAPTSEEKAKERPWIVSARLDNLGIEEAVDRVMAPLGGRGPRIVHYAHPHCLNLAHRDPALAQCLERADLVLPDGIGIRVAGRILGIPMGHNLNGTDMWPQLIERAAAEGLPVALIGSAAGVAEAAGERIRRLYPELELALCSHGYLTDEDSRSVAASVAELGPCLVLVGMGSPRQELWVWEQLAGMPDTIVVTVGALFDYVSGEMTRAPVIWRELGLEWAYRLAKEPRRLARRYLLGNPIFLARALLQRLRSAWRPRLFGRSN